MSLLTAVNFQGNPKAVDTSTLLKLKQLPVVTLSCEDDRHSWSANIWLIMGGIQYKPSELLT